MDADGALAIGLLAQGAAVLPMDADGVLALLGGRRVVDDEDGRGRGERLGHPGAVPPGDRLLVPGALAEELLQRLVGVGDRQAGWQRDGAGHRLDALAVGVLEQSAEVDAAPGGLAGAVEVVAEYVREGDEPVEDVGREFGGVGAVHTLVTNPAGKSFVEANGVALATSAQFRPHFHLHSCRPISGLYADSRDETGSESLRNGFQVSPFTRGDKACFLNKATFHAISRLF